MIKYDHSFSKIDKIIPKTAQQYQLQEAMVKHQVLRYWEEAATAFIAEADTLTKALYFEGGVVVIACLSEQLAKEIRLFAARIVYALNQLIGKNVVESIR